jgi:hypothetical protein
MAENSSAPHGFPQRVLPWALAGVFLVVYLVTLNPWVGANSLDLLTRISGRDGDNLLTLPLVYVLTLPIKGLGLAKLPVVTNVLAAVLGALVVGILARCVALLPHDRTREQRMRGQSEPGPLRIKLAWAPPVFAAGLLGLQLTFWEQATTFTGEMVDLLVFAFCVQCLLEYRVRQNERWLLALALAFGLGMANNWAMFAFAPLFLVAVVWTRAWSFFHNGFLVRMTLSGMLGLGLYLLMPLVVSSTAGSETSFGSALNSVLVMQKSYLIGVPRGRSLLVAIVTLLPLALIGIRWVGAKGTSMETILNIAAVAVLHSIPPSVPARSSIWILPGAACRCSRWPSRAPSPRATSLATCSCSAARNRKRLGIGPARWWADSSSSDSSPPSVPPSRCRLPWWSRMSR